MFKKSFSFLNDPHFIVNHAALNENGVGRLAFLLACASKDQKENYEGWAIRVPHVLPRKSGEVAGNWGF